MEWKKGGGVGRCRSPNFELLAPPPSQAGRLPNGKIKKLGIVGACKKKKIFLFLKEREREQGRVGGGQI